MQDLDEGFYSRCLRGLEENMHIRQKRMGFGDGEAVGIVEITPANRLRDLGLAVMEVAHG